MKKLVVFAILLVLSGCVIVGDFPENRQRLHNQGFNTDEYCREHPQHCRELLAEPEED